MKNKFILLPIFLVATVFIFGTGIPKKSAGPPPYYAGAPSEQTCTASGCHDGVTGIDNMGTGGCSIVFGNNYTTYAALDTYIVKVNATQAACTKFGFQIVALINSSNAPAGNAFITDAVRTQRRDNSNVTWGCCQTRQWIEHTAPGNVALAIGSTNWTYKWVAPSSNVGSITFYLATLAADGNGNDSLDYTYTKTLTITFDSTTGSANGIRNIVSNNNTLQLSPNPCKEKLSVFSNQLSANTTLQVFDIYGKKIMEQPIDKSLNQQIINSSNLPSGLYFLKIKSNQGEQAAKFIKQ